MLFFAVISPPLVYISAIFCVSLPIYLFIYCIKSTFLYYVKLDILKIITDRRDTFMYLEELDLQYLINSVRSVCGKPIFILNPNWSVISCTHQGFTEYAQEIAAFCASDNDYGTAASRFGIIIEPCILEETLICYFMILDKKSGYMIPYLKTLTELLIYPKSDSQFQKHVNQPDCQHWSEEP